MSSFNEIAEVQTPPVLGLPASAYTTQEFMLLEQSRLFPHQWMAIGFAHDVPKPGDIQAVDSAAGKSLLMVRGEDSEIRVFHNFCRHRGMRLVADQTRGARNILCPYHAWCYGLDGKLIRIPHRHGFGTAGLEPGDPAGLERVRSVIWNGIVFANLSGTAPAFADFIAPLEKMWARFDFSLLVPGDSTTFELEGNWKLAIENFIDIYHVPFVHPALNEYIDITAHQFIQEGPVLGQGSETSLPTDVAAGKLPYFPRLTQSQKNTIEAISLFPNLLLTVFGDNLRAILIEPTGPRSCRERVEIFFVGEESLAPELEEFRNIIAARFPAFNKEDIGVVEGLQRNFESSAFNYAHFLEFFDDNVKCFQQRVAKACAQT